MFLILKHNIIMKLILLIIINIIGLIHVESRPQQIIIRQAPNQPIVNPPHLAPIIKATHPKSTEKSSGPRNIRQISVVHPRDSKSSKDSPTSHPHMPVSAPQKSRVVVTPSKYVPVEQKLRNGRQVSSNDYNAPVSSYSTAPVNSYSTTALEARPTTVEARRVPASTQKSYNTRRAQKPIAITRYVYNSPTGEEKEGDSVFDYSFETEHGIKQSAEGTMRMVDETPVVVMRGSYEYVDNGVTYEVVWEADENGFRPSAPKSKHLPKVVQIPFPEQQAAVDAQIRFADEENRLRAAASENTPSYNVGGDTFPAYSGVGK